MTDSVDVKRLRELMAKTTPVRMQIYTDLPREDRDLIEAAVNSLPALLNLADEHQRMKEALRQVVELSTNYGDVGPDIETTEWENMQEAYDEGCRAGAMDAANVARSALPQGE